jgi:hypothetical protein
MRRYHAAPTRPLKAMIFVSGQFKLAIVFFDALLVSTPNVPSTSTMLAGYPRWRLMAGLNLTVDKTRILSGAFAADAEALKR